MYIYISYISYIYICISYIYIYIYMGLGVGLLNQSRPELLAVRPAVGNAAAVRPPLAGL